MSTRSVIARTCEGEGEFVGRYVHADGMPLTQGPLLFQILRNEFHGDLKRMLVYMLDKHPAGWSSILPDYRSCYCHPKQAKGRDDFKQRKSEPAQTITHKDIAEGTDLEWAYIFDEENQRMFVRDIRHDAESIVELANEPTKEGWTKIECGENFERCGHYAWYHGLLPKTSNLSTAVWLGNRPLDFHDVIAFVINGKRYTATGCGGNSDFYSTALARSHGFTKRFPANSWVASVKAGNGHRLEVAVAKCTPDGYLPLPGVLFVYPPTKNNPTETMVSA
jgi:hypothetical protein